MPEYRVADKPVPYQKPRQRQITGPADVDAACRHLARRRQEEVWVLLLDSHHRLLRRVIVAKGTLNSAAIEPREVFRTAIVASACAIVLVHNHPSGDPEPSDDDRRLTKRIAEAGELVGIRLLDHVVVARGGYASLREHGVL